MIGHPVAHSRSPLLHGHWLGEHAIAGTYERIDVAPAGLEAFVLGLPESGFAGGNVTVPHKEAVFRLLRQVTPQAERLGAVNTLTVEPDGRVLGHNTDGEGFVANLADTLGPGWAREVRSALVIGAGGAARAVAAALLDAGLQHGMIVNRSLPRAEELRTLDPARLDASPWSALPAGLAAADLLVNTTSLGMAGQPPLPIDLGGLREGAVVADIVYVPLETPLLAAARARGLRAVDGLGMLLHQAVPGFRAWFGPTPRVTPELRLLLASEIERRP